MLEFTPSGGQKTLTGNGSATKAAVARCVAMELGQSQLLEGLRHDATDGLALRSRLPCANTWRPWA
ncbi:MAG: hypothetical protein R3E96_02305 [Planctomycetota bacterium]